MAFALARPLILLIAFAFAVLSGENLLAFPPFSFS